MTTIIYPSPIFGPVHSRRLGVSLGVNLMPSDGKVCSFDCIYCECGFNDERRPRRPRPTREQVREALDSTLAAMRSRGEHPDVITFAGNGEPTLHPKFPEIIDDTIRLRDEHCPDAKISVLSNATTAHRPAVHAALMRVDNNILKLDTVDNRYIRLVDRPANKDYDAAKIVAAIRSFDGHAIVQTMFLCGSFDGVDVDNTSDDYVTPWLDAVTAAAPSQVMIYTIDRDTPADGLRKAPREVLDSIRDRVVAAGIACTASY